MNTPKITPLGIIATFVTLTEMSLGYGVTKVTGGIQIALTSFVIIFAVLTLVGFFLILWNRPYVFYPPSEYGGNDPNAFVSAIRQGSIPKLVAEQVQLAASVERNPLDQNAQFALIDSMIDEVHRQYLILMHVMSIEIPYPNGHSPQDIYEMEYGQGSASTGGFNPHGFVKKLEATEFLQINARGPMVGLTQAGHDFAGWLIENGRKATYMKCSLGSWGEARLGSPLTEIRQRRAAAEQVTFTPTPPRTVG